MTEGWQREMRQRRYVKQVLVEYRSGRSGLHRLAEDLYSLANEFRLAPEEWVEELRANANGLEALYAIALDQGFADNLPDDYLRDADAAVERVEQLLEQLPPPPDEVEDGVSY